MSKKITAISEIDNDTIKLQTDRTYDSEIDFNKYYPDNTTSFNTMIPLCLYVNNKKQLSRIQLPSINTENKVTCEFSKYDNDPEWKVYNFWVFNIANLPPLPLALMILQVTNNNDSPYNLQSLSPHGIGGNPTTNPDSHYFTNDKGIFNFINEKNQWRFVTYYKPVPNTVKLYVYDTSLKPDFPKKLLKERDGQIRSFPKLFVTPERNDKLVLSKQAPYNIWVCTKPYTRFKISDAIIIPSDKGYGYFTAIKKTIPKIQNWIKYKSGSANTLREELHKLNYNTTIHPWWEKNIITVSILIIVIFTLATFYLFKK